jgi:hypothetical protein
MKQANCTVEQRIQLAYNPQTPVDALKQLAADEYRTVRCEVADNPSTPAGVLEQLATDTNVGVRWCVAHNPSTPGDILKQLAADEDSYVRLCVVRHPSLPLDSAAVQDLMIDPDPSVKAATMERLANHLRDLLLTKNQGKSAL